MDSGRDHIHQRQFLYVDAVGNELFSANNNVAGGELTSTTLSAPTTIAAPASLAFFGASGCWQSA